MTLKKKQKNVTFQRRLWGLVFIFPAFIFVITIPVAVVDTTLSLTPY